MNMSLADLKKYYENTTIFIDKIPYYILSIQKTTIFGYNILTKEVVALDSTAHYTFSDALPKKLCINHKGFSYLIYRLPYQMWKKGIHEKNTNVLKLDVSGWEVSKLSIANLAIETIQYPVLDENSYTSVALSPYVSLCKDKIYLYTHLVGTYSDQTVSCRPYIKEFLLPVFPKCTFLM